MANKKAYATHSAVVECSEPELWAGLFDATYSEEHTRSLARFVGDVLASPNRSTHRVEIGGVTTDGRTFKSALHRHAAGEYASRLKFTWTEPGTLKQAGSRRIVDVRGRWRRGRLELELLNSVEFVAAGVLRAWAFGETEVSNDAPAVLRAELQDLAGRMQSDRTIFFPVSREHVEWTAARSAELLRRLAREVGALLGEEIVVHPSLGDTQPKRKVSAGPKARAKSPRTGGGSPRLVDADKAQLLRGIANGIGALIEQRSGGRVVEAPAIPLQAKATPDNSKKPKSRVRHFSGSGAGDFSLRAQMASVGISSIDDFYQRLALIREAPGELTVLANALASIPDDDDLGRVLARMMFACSCVDVDGPVMDKIVAGLLLAKVRPPAGEAHGMPVSRFAVMVCCAGVDGARQSGLGRSCVDSLGLIADIWCRDLSNGDQRIGGQVGRAWVAAAVLVYLAEVSAGTPGGIPAVTTSLQGGAVPGRRQQVAEMWALGRAWARANGVEFDEFVRRHS